MRAIPPALQARLDSGATRLCRCWRVRRRDGVALGFTDHDRDLVFDGTTFRASTGMDATAVQASTGLAVDNAAVMGALSDAGVTEAAVRAGRYDGARVEHWLADWSEPALRVLMFVGEFGEIKRADGAFEAELRGLTEALNAPVGRVLHPRCDRRLGDARCGVDVAAPAFSVEAVVGAAASAGAFAVMGAGGHADGWFAGGLIEWIAGANAGLTGAIRSDRRAGDGTRRLELWREAGAPVLPGDRARLVAGCDKTAETCRSKFGNFLNFRGFPHIPGDDWVTAYPRSGEVHDGSRRR